MKKAGTVLVIMLMLVLGCKDHETKMAPKMSSEAESVSEQTLALKLDNGQKWQANLETHEGIEKMDSIITAFKTTDDKNYQALGEKLSTQTSYVIKNCTMKGESHDQLHVVLVPMLDDISVLKEANDPTSSQNALEDLEQAISSYFGHFKI